jgi:hypothetical protein
MASSRRFGLDLQPPDCAVASAGRPNPLSNRRGSLISDILEILGKVVFFAAGGGNASVRVG